MSPGLASARRERGEAGHSEPRVRRVRARLSATAPSPGLTSAMKAAHRCPMGPLGLHLGGRGRDLQPRVRRSPPPTLRNRRKRWNFAACDVKEWFPRRRPTPGAPRCSSWKGAWPANRPGRDSGTRVFKGRLSLAGLAVGKKEPSPVRRGMGGPGDSVMLRWWLALPGPRRARDRLEFGEKRARPALSRPDSAPRAPPPTHLRLGRALGPPASRRPLLRSQRPGPG